MNILFLGLGSIGRRHAKLIMDNYPEHTLYAIRSGKGLYGELDGVTDITWFDIEDVKPDCAFVCTPTKEHIDDVIDLLTHGIKSIFLEKPICSNIRRLKIAVEFAEYLNATVYVAYPLRFNQTIASCVDIDRMTVYCITDARKWPTYRKTKQDGGGVLLELSHEIDYIGYLLGGVKSISGRVKFQDGLDSQAKLTIKGKYGKCNVYLDLFSNIESRGFGKWEIYVTDEVFLAQIEYFFANMNNPSIMNNLKEASDMFRKLIKFREEKYAM